MFICQNASLKCTLKGSEFIVCNFYLSKLNLFFRLILAKQGFLLHWNFRFVKEIFPHSVLYDLKLWRRGVLLVCLKENWALVVQW